jgi:hypothetical protein
MPRSSADPPKTAGQVNVYWRRRVIALAAGLGLLALVTWTVNGALGGGTTRQATDLSQTTRQHSAQHPSPPASATPGNTAGSAGATPSATATPTPSPSSSAKRHPAGQRGWKAAAARATGSCPHADLVLSLFSARYSYPAHTRLQFSVDVVSTAPGRCTADLGGAHLHIVIQAGGKHQVWDSADCAGAAARATTLARGVPAAVQITWNRKTSAPGCRAPHRAVRAGTYTATAYSGKLSSRAMAFVLKGP